MIWQTMKAALVALALAPMASNNTPLVKLTIAYSATSAPIVAAGDLYFTVSGSGDSEPFFPEGSDVLLMPLTTPESYMVGCVKKFEGETLVADIRKSVGEGVFSAWAVYLISTGIITLTKQFL